MNDLIRQSKEIIDQAILDYTPFAIVSMVSGGDDSLAAYYALRACGVTPNFILHGITGTGIPETTQFVREWASTQPSQYIEADAGAKYEEYVLRKGFFGRGGTAHTYAYHVLKAHPFRKALSKHIRQRKWNRRILLINGAREDESKNRSKNIGGTINFDRNTDKNIWVNINWHWSKQNCRDHLGEIGIDRNPVSCALGRSGECLCGTMQSELVRLEASALYPHWGEWLDDLEQRVIDSGFLAKWGEETRASSRRRTMEEGQQSMLPEDQLFMCASCKG